MFSVFAEKMNRGRRGLQSLTLLALLMTLVACGMLPARHRGDLGGKVCIAHRGASAYAPEHTLAAYTLALEMGADYVEQDLQLTRDGVLVCMHDTSLERTTDVEEVYPDRFDSAEYERSGRKTWQIVDFSLEEIRQLDAGSWFGPEFKDERIPTFQESLDLVMGKAGIYPELKEPGYYESFGMNMVDAVILAFQANGLDTPKGQRRTPILVQSFSPEALKEMKDKAGDRYRLIQLIGFAQAGSLFSDEALPEVARYAWGVGPSIAILRGDPTRIPAARMNGLMLHPYTVSQASLPPEFDSLEDYTVYLLYDLGVDGVFTNNPDLFSHEQAMR